MKFVSAVALIMLTLVSYSSGIVLARRAKQVMPDVLDLFTALVLCTAAVWTGRTLGHWTGIGIWVATGLVIGAIASYTRKRPAALGIRYPIPGADTETKRGFVAAWKTFALRMGNFQGRMIMGFFYFILATPFVLINRFGVDPLRLKRPAGGTYWVQREPIEHSLEAARRQF